MYGNSLIVEPNISLHKLSTTITEGRREFVYFRDPNRVTVVVGDIHENLPPLKELVKCLLHRSQQGQSISLFLVGDYLDKGKNTRETVEYVYDLVKSSNSHLATMLVQGNHETYVVREIRKFRKNPNKYQMEESAISFDSLPIILQNEDLADKVLELWNGYSAACIKVQPYTQDSTSEKGMYITHAPCDEKYLDDTTDEATQNKRTILTARGTQAYKDDYRTFYPYIFEQADISKPWHLFGHVAHGSENTIYKNKVFLDTGSVYGGGLSYAIYQGDGLEVQTIPSDRIVDKPLINTLTTPLN